MVVSGLLLLTGLGFSAWHSGGWINVAVIVVMAVVAVLGFLGTLPQQAAARAGRCAARGGTACGYRTARRIWTDFVSSPGLS